MALPLLLAAAPGILVLGVLALVVHLHRIDRAQARRLHTAVVDAGSARLGTGVRVSGHNLHKAAKVIGKSAALFQAAGCGPHTRHALHPVLLAVEGLVYRGDDDVEAEQQGATAEGGWHEALSGYLSELDAADPATRAALDDLRRYFDLESRLVTAADPPSESAVAEVTRLRSSDVLLLLRLAYRLRGAEPDEGFLRLIRPWLMIEEIREDLGSYHADVASGSFNTLATYVRMYGPDGPRRFRAMRARLVRRGILEVSRAPRRSLGTFWPAYLGHTGPSAGLLAAVLRRAPRVAHTFIAGALMRSEDRWLGAVPEPVIERTTA